MFAYLMRSPLNAFRAYRPLPTACIAYVICLLVKLLSIFVLAMNGSYAEWLISNDWVCYQIEIT